MRSAGLNPVRRNSWLGFGDGLGPRTAVAIVVHGAPRQGLRDQNRHIGTAGSREARNGIRKNRYRRRHIAEQAIGGGLLYRLRELGIHEPDVARYPDALRSS